MCCSVVSSCSSSPHTLVCCNKMTVCYSVVSVCGSKISSCLSSPHTLACCSVIGNSVIIAFPGALKCGVGVLQCVAVWFRRVRHHRIPWCVAVGCRCVAGCCRSVAVCVAVCCRCVAVSSICPSSPHTHVRCSVLQCDIIFTCCSVLQRVAV